jgi:predicted TIM-barrel fold metal-dependent hydrolase
MKIIDCHLNVGWDNSNLRRNLFPTEQTFKQALIKMRDHGVSKSIIVPFPSPGGQFSQNAFWYEVENQYLINATRYSSKFLAFPAVNPKDLASVKNIHSLAVAYAIKGIKFSHQIPMDFDIDQLIDHPLMQIVKDNNLIVMIHIGTGKEAGANQVHVTLDYAIKVAKHYPTINFIFCHLGRLHQDILAALSLANVYMDTAGFSLGNNWSHFVAKNYLLVFKNMNPSQIIEYLVYKGFAKKLIFGSDEPYVSYKKELEIITSANISKADKERILALNMEKLLMFNRQS